MFESSCAVGTKLITDGTVVRCGGIGPVGLGGVWSGAKKFHVGFGKKM